MLERLRGHLPFAAAVLLLGAYFLYSRGGVFDWRVQVALYAGAALLVLAAVLNRGRLAAFFSSQRGKRGSVAGVTVLLVIGILALINFLNIKNNHRFDLTSDRLHALSSQSAEVVSSLDKEVSLTAFLAGDAGGRELQELMREYRQASKRIDFRIVDPEADPLTAQKYDVRRAGQAVVSVGDQSETIDLLDFNGGWQSNNEERITNAIIKVTRREQKAIYFLQGHGERDIEDNAEEGYRRVADELRKKSYKVEQWNVAEESRLPEDAAVLISAGPQVDFFPNEVEALKTYLAGGGKLLLLVDPRTDFKMNDFLSQYGLGLDNDLVLDVSGVGRFLQLGPAVPLAATYAEHPITKEVGGVMTFYPLAQSVGTGESTLGYTSKALVSTSSRCWGETDMDNPQPEYDQDVDKAGPLDLAAVSTKAIDETPAAKPSEDAGESAAGDQGKEADQERGDKPEENVESRIVLFGDSDFANNRFFGEGRNGDVFLLTVSWLAQDEGLLGIRPRNPTDRRVNLTVAEAQMVRWLSAALLPLATLGLGIFIWFSRR